MRRGQSDREEVNAAGATGTNCKINTGTIRLTMYFARKRSFKAANGSAREWS